MTKKEIKYKPHRILKIYNEKQKNKRKLKN